MVANNAFMIEEMKEKVKKEGKKEEQIEIAKKLLKLGVAVDKVIQGTGLSEKIIKELSKEVKS